MAKSIAGNNYYNDANVVGYYYPLHAHPCIVLHRESSSICASEVICKVASRLPEPWTTTLFAERKKTQIADFPIDLHTYVHCTIECYTHHHGVGPWQQSWQHWAAWPRAPTNQRPQDDQTNCYWSSGRRHCMLHTQTHTHRKRESKCWNNTTIIGPTFDQLVEWCL